ncbi:MAG: hypothetical protein AB8B99_01105 [Phormidesmis sp.]
MIFSKRFNPAKLFKTSLLTLAALGLALPTASYAQQRLSNEQPSRAVLEDGTYLFGQSPTRDVLGATYAVLSVQDNRAVGAFYQPRSSYDCFSGDVSPTRLAVNIVDSYSQAVYPYAVALTLSDSLVAGAGAGAYTLEGFHRIDNLSDKDAEMLAVCAADMTQ